MYLNAKIPLLKEVKTSILLSTYRAYSAWWSRAKPPKITYDFNFYASSIANFISNPGVNGWKSDGRALYQLVNHNQVYNFNLNIKPLGLF